MRTDRNHHDTPAHKYAYVERWLQEMTPANAEALRPFLRLKHGQGLAANTLALYVQSLRHFDRTLGGRQWVEATPEDATALLARMRTAGYAHDTIVGTAAYTKAFLKWHLNVPQLPPQMLYAFRIHNNRRLPDRPVLSLDEEATIMEALPCLRDQVAFGLLIEGGFRISEMLALNVGSFEFDDINGAWVTIPHDAPNLKTGPRRLYISKYARLVAAYLATHPQRDAPDAPLLLSLDFKRRLRPGARLNDQGVSGALARARKATGVRHFRLHDLRHTAATRLSEAGANAKDFQERFGWSQGSNMPSHYAHHSRAHQERMARKAAGVNDYGLAQTASQEAGLKACPMCAEDIKEAALKCKHCGSLVAEARQE